MKNSNSNTHLFYDEKKRLCLQNGENKIYVDFTTGAVEHRRKFGGGLGQSIAKAIGITGKYKPYVIDATAGLGKDSFVLASLGCEVLMLERSSFAYQLLQDGLQRSKEVDTVEKITNKMHLIFGNAIEYLSKLVDNEKPDVVYLDPMFPHSKKSRLVKKDMQVFQSVIGDDADANDLLKISLSKAKVRVVVKRPKNSHHLGGIKPSHSIIGKSSRFDVYMI